MAGLLHQQLHRCCHSRSPCLQAQGPLPFTRRVRSDAIQRRLLAVRAASGTVQAEAASSPWATAPGKQLLQWLSDNGAAQDALELRMVDLPTAGRPLDVAVAARGLQPGDIALSVPENLVVTLDRIFECESLAEQLTVGKLSELACLTLFLMYEKKTGKDSFWYTYIKELDRQRARGVQAVESPLLWPEDELKSLLQGSPVLAAVQERLEGMEKEYQELDTVWFMAGSLFNRYPFDVPTEAFTFKLFKQAFAAVQASCVHLQGVPYARRFALVPMGPPLLTYSSTCKAILAYNPETRAVELKVDRAYQPGDPVYAWCGPQPNSRLLINYGICDENNPYDKLPVTVTLDNADPLFKAKRGRLQDEGLATMQAFDLKRNAPLPAALLPFMRLGYASTAEEVAQVSFAPDAPAISTTNEQAVACGLATYLNKRLAAYKHTLQQDLDILADPKSSPRAKVAARLTKIEKSILKACLDAVAENSPCTGAGSTARYAPRLS